MNTQSAKWVTAGLEAEIKRLQKIRRKSLLRFKEGTELYDLYHEAVSYHAIAVDEVIEVLDSNIQKILKKAESPVPESTKD